MVEVVDRPQSQQVLSRRWVSKPRLDGSCKLKLVARGFFFLTNSKLRYRFLRWNAKAHDFARTSHDRSNSRKSSCHSAFHQSLMPTEPELVYVEQHLKHSWTLPRYGFARKLFDDSRSFLRTGAFTTQKINDMNQSQLISDLSTYVKKRAQRSDDSSTLDSDGVCVSNSTGCSRLLQLSHSRRTTHLHGTLKTRHAICHPTTIHTSPFNPTTESERAVKQFIRHIKGTQHTCHRLEPRQRFKQVCWNSLVAVAQVGSTSRPRQSITGYHVDVQIVTMRNRSLKQTVSSLSSCETEFYAANAFDGD